jgi:hypothetical protein
MQDLRELQTADPKTAAKRLRTALRERNIDLSHGECLDLVARQLGLKNWNVLAAKLSREPEQAERISLPEGWMLDGENTDSFAGGLDGQEHYLGLPVFWLRNEDGKWGFATVMQVVSGEPYRGKRVHCVRRMSAGPLPSGCAQTMRRAKTSPSTISKNCRSTER